MARSKGPKLRIWTPTCASCDAISSFAPACEARFSASGVYPQLPVLVCESGQLSGQTYNEAQGVFVVTSLPQPDGRVRLELVPELQHDQPRQRWVGNQGIIRLDASRPKRVYADMAITADLSPGAMLVLSSLANRPGSLGHDFFTQNDGRLEQKLLVVRLAQTQHDGLFNPPEPLKLEEQEGQRSGFRVQRPQSTNQESQVPDLWPLIPRPYFSVFRTRSNWPAEPSIVFL